MKMYRFKTKVLPFLLAGALALTAAGCTSTEGGEKAQPADDKKVTLMLPFKSGKMDPHNDLIAVRAGVTETLIKLNEDLQLEGWLAEQWEATDEKTWVFTIRDGVTFHDGAKVDAAAVQASFERAIAASKSVNTALKIEAMEADGQMLTVKTTEPHPALPSELVNPYTSVIHAEAEKTMGAEAFNNAPVGTGPFKVKQFTANVEAQFERYDGYWGGQPKLKEAAVKFNEDANVRALALQSGEADIVYNLPAESVEAITKDESLQVESLSSLRVHFILYNQKKELMQDIKVRQALNILLDRESVAKDIMAGNATAANGPFNSELPFGSKDSAAKLDIEKAKSLLKEAGYQAGADGKMMKDGKPLTLELVTYKARPELPLIAQFMQSDAAKAGVTINIKMVENVDTYLQENADWDTATYSAITAPRGDGSYFLNTALTPEGALNAGDINISALNETIQKLNATSDMQERISITKEAVSIINKEMPHSYVVYPNIIVGMNTRVTDWQPGRDEYYMLTHTLDVK